MSGNLFARFRNWFVPASGRPDRMPIPPFQDASRGGRTSAPQEHPSLETEAIVDQLRAAVRHCNMGSGDPTLALVTAFVHAIRHLGARTAASDRIAQESSNAILGALLQAKKVTDAEIERIRVSLPVPGSDAFQQYSREIAKNADTALARRIQVFDRNTALLAALVLFTVSATSCGVGYWQGGKAAYADMHAVQQGLTSLFSEKLADTKAMLNLLRWNPVVSALSQCEQSGRTSTLNGRKYCNVLLWMEDTVSVVRP